MLPYVREAYDSSKFAFVTDVVRLYALYHEGGVYMDTDVEILKPLDELASLSAYTGYEGSKHLPPVTGIMASESHGIWVKEQLDYYSLNRHFIIKRSDSSFDNIAVDGKPILDLTPNTVTITRIMTENGFVPNGGKKQTYKDLTIYPVEYFCPRQTTGEYFKTENTYCDHHFCGSWTNSENSKGIFSILPKPIRIALIKLKRKIIG